MNRRRPKRTFWANCLHKAKNNRAILIDVSSRVLFPLTFLAFNIIYWIMYALLLQCCHLYQQSKVTGRQGNSQMCSIAGTSNTKTIAFIYPYVYDKHVVLYLLLTCVEILRYMLKYQHNYTYPIPKCHDTFSQQNTMQIPLIVQCMYLLLFAVPPSIQPNSQKKNTHIPTAFHNQVFRLP